jgi:acyl-CoA synthetase (AMP-forming)/AMP-acid ligase II
MSITLVLEMAASGLGDRLAVGRREDGMTYADLHRRAANGAAGFLAAGVRQIAYLGTAGDAFPVALFASAWAGIPFVPLNFRLGDDQLDTVLGELDTALVIADATSLPRAEGHGHAVVERDVWLSSTDTAATPPLPADDDSAVALLLYTSGTTSRPKAAVLRHRHLLSYLLGSLEFGGADAAEAALVSVPPYHIAGVTSVLSNVYTGRRIVFLDAFTPARWLEVARGEEATHAMLVPTMLARIVVELDRAGAADAGLDALASIAYGGARMPITVLERALDLFPATGFVNAYGLTETSSTIALLGPEDHRAARDGDPVARARLRSAGKLIAGIEVQVRGDDGEEMAIGEIGELWVRGDQVSGEYVGQASAADGDRWFSTRDRAWVDEQGYLFIEGRSDDTIIRGGENIAPTEIEDVLLEHPAVFQAAVVGIPDDEWGQRIGAAVVLREENGVTASELREWTRERLRSSKTPEELVLWPALPHTDTGKLLRREVLAGLLRAEVK